MRILQTAIYRFINKWLDVKSLEGSPFPQQLQEQIITIQVGLQWKFLDWQESLTAVLTSKSPWQEIQCQRVRQRSHKPSQYALNEHILELKYITVNNTLN